MQMANLHMIEFSLSLALREMQSEAQCIASTAIGTVVLKT